MREKSFDSRVVSSSASASFCGEDAERALERPDRGQLFGELLLRGPPRLVARIRSWTGPTCTCRGRCCVPAAAPRGKGQQSGSQGERTISGRRTELFMPPIIAAGARAESASGRCFGPGANSCDDCFHERRGAICVRIAGIDGAQLVRRMMLTRCHAEKAWSWLLNSASPLRYTENGLRMSRAPAARGGSPAQGRRVPGVGRTAVRRGRAGSARGPAPPRGTPASAPWPGHSVSCPVRLRRLAARSDDLATVRAASNSIHPCQRP